MIDIAAAMKSANGQKPTPSGAYGCSQGETAKPSAIGTSTLATPTRPAERSWARTPCGARSSRPTTNMKSTSPSSASEASPSSDSGGNSAAWMPGSQAPNTIGPSTRPAAISPITGGWPR